MEVFRKQGHFLSSLGTISSIISRTTATKNYVICTNSPTENACIATSKCIKVTT